MRRRRFIRMLRNPVSHGSGRAWNAACPGMGCCPISHRTRLRNLLTDIDDTDRQVSACQRLTQPVW